MGLEVKMTGTTESVATVPHVADDLARGHPHTGADATGDPVK